MRKAIFFFLVFFINYYPLICQSFPTRSDEPVWTVYDGEYQITVGESDTLINNQYWTPLVGLFSSSSGLVDAFYRVDGQKVFFKTDGVSDSPDYLMYDFSLVEGDSVYIGIPGTYPSIDSVLYYVLATDTMFFGGVPRKRMLMGFYIDVSPTVLYGTFWVDGIGDLNFPFPPITCLDGSDDAGFCIGCAACISFDCLQTNQGVIYSSGAYLNCEYSQTNLTRIYVDQNVGTSAQNGSSWQYAFDDLQEAIEIAEPGDSIWVAQGTCYPTENTDREVFFHLNEGVKIFGGFKGTETNLNERNWEACETILSGDIGIQGDSTDNSYHVVYTIGTDSTAVLDGFTITRGYAIHPSSGYFGSLNRGGGFLVDTKDVDPETSPIIRNCHFILNVGAYGGALACNGEYGRYANPSLSGCVFSKNQSTNEGGAIYKLGPNIEYLAGNYTNCSFEENWSLIGAGAIYFLDVCNSQQLVGCTFTNNVSAGGAGAIFYLPSCNSGEVIIKDSHFESNVGVDGGGFGFIDNNYPDDELPKFNFEIINCTFLQNETPFSSGAGLFFAPGLDSCYIKIENSSFLNNYAGEGGGGIYIFSGAGSVNNIVLKDNIFINNNIQFNPTGGAITVFGQLFSAEYHRTYIKVENNSFAHNRGGISISSGNGLVESSLKNCSFFDNGNYPLAKNWSSTFDYLNVYNDFAISNSIIWEPQVPLKQVFYNGSLTNQHLYDYSINNCLISQSACDLPGGDEACNEGMIFGQNPMFVNAEVGDLRVGGCSPAINAGDVTFIPDLETDIEGNPRVLENIPDMGAYERETFWMEQVGTEPETCPDGEDGFVVFETNGIQPLSYFWKMGVLADTVAAGLAPGEYMFTVTDAAGCQDTFDIVIPEAEGLQTDYQIQDASAFNAWDGAITLQTISGAMPPYQFFWNTEDTTASLENIPSGWYVLNVLDANDCLYTWNFQVGWVNANGAYYLAEAPEIFPNPVMQGQPVLLKFPQVQGNFDIRVFDATGRVFPMAEFQRTDAEIQIPTDLWSSGLYFIQVESSSGQVWIFKQAVY